MTTTDTMHAVYYRNTFRGRWQLDSIHPTRELAMAAALDVRAAHVWITTVPAPKPVVDPTRDPVGGLTPCSN